MPSKKTIVDTILKDKQLSIREKASPVFVVVIIVLTTIFLLIPSFNQIIETQRNLQIRENVLTTINQKIQMLSIYVSGEKQTDFENKFKTVEAYLPSSKPSLAILLNLTNLSRQEQVKFSGLTLNPGVVKKPGSEEKEAKNQLKREEIPQPVENSLSNFEIKFTISGRKNNIQSFLSRLKTLAPLMKVESFSTSMDEDENAGQGLIMSADVTVLVYYQELPTVLPSYDSALEAVTPQEEETIQLLSDYMRTIAGGGVEPQVITEPLGNLNPFGSGPAK